MKLWLEGLQQPLITDGEGVTTLVIENQELMMRVLSDIYAQSQGEAGNSVLSSNGKTVDINKGLDLLVDFVAFDGNRKGLLTKIVNALEKTANDEVYFQRTHKLLAELECYLNDLAMEQDVELTYEKLSLNNLLKSVGARVVIDYNKLVERLFAYMDLVRRFEGEKLFLLVNLRSFVSNEDVELFMQTVVAHGLQVLLVDNQAYPHLPLERRRIIDMDLCEI